MGKWDAITNGCVRLNSTGVRVPFSSRDSSSSLSSLEDSVFASTVGAISPPVGRRRTQAQSEGEGDNLSMHSSLLSLTDNNDEWEEQSDASFSQQLINCQNQSNQAQVKSERDSGFQEDW